MANQSTPFIISWVCAQFPQARHQFSKTPARRGGTVQEAGPAQWAPVATSEKESPTRGQSRRKEPTAPRVLLLGVRKTHTHTCLCPFLQNPPHSVHPVLQPAVPT